MSTITIVSRWNSSRVLFTFEATEEQQASGLAMRAALEAATRSGADLSGADLSGADLRGADLSGAVLRGADLRGADLSGADLSGADLRGADLSGADLSGADLRGADLRGADLSGAVLRGADGNPIERASDKEAIANLDKVRAIVMDDASRLYMGHWHGDNAWKDRTCAEETLCGTTHCMAGWLQVCSTNPAIRSHPEAHIAGILAAPVAAKMFFRGNAEALDWLSNRKYVADIEEANKRSAERKARREAKSAA